MEVVVVVAKDNSDAQNLEAPDELSSQYPTIKICNSSCTPCVTKILITSPLAVFLKYGQLHFSKASDSISDFDISRIFCLGHKGCKKTKSRGSNIYNIQNPITLAWIDAIFLVFFKILINWKSPHKSLLFHPLLCFVVVVGRVREHRFICCVFQLDPPETGTSSHLNLNLVASANSL